ncbi:hypothetical protein [Nonomuraea zeae]|uniref:Uncharacterized protein n=1 Tax=Nonomuraea zeae TaxID=1642303 RepID=A0A5S4FYN4_9ACTN|nr:hypothetical protein [Nonomuraea zeae]TMR25917.1 hypothetical protein ETD85_44270 [Nonomuraea zeae]
MSTTQKVGLVISVAAMIAIIGFVLAGKAQPGPAALIAQDNAREAEVLGAARAVARELDGRETSVTMAEVEAALLRQPGGGAMQLGGSLDSMDFSDNIHTYEIRDADGAHPACLSVQSIFDRFEYTTKAWAEGGAC